MPFPFILVCDLLAQVEKEYHSAKQDRLTPSAITSAWFKKYRHVIDNPDTNIAALFSTILPEKRTDRVYGIQEPTLFRIIGRAFCLGISRLEELKRYQRPGSGLDLADCVASTLDQAPNPLYDPKKPVTIEEIDSLLHAIASTCRFSSAKVRSSRSAAAAAEKNDLGALYCRLGPIEAKWLTRLILKNYGPATLEPALVYRNYDRNLPVILQIQDDFEVALESMRKLRNAYPLATYNVLKQVKPLLGTKIGRQHWLKGRSIKNCIDMSPSRVSCESKMDGEYCQIHVDLSKGRNSIQIFSKSAKDSTQDRISLHGAIRESLRLQQSSQAISKGCILEGEMVVYNDKQKKILPFEKIRKYVKRSGQFIGVDQDSPPDPNEHLMIVYFDVLLIDNESLLGLRQTERFDRLKKLITCRTGHVELVQRQIIDLDRHMGASHLRNALAKCITMRGEGIVLKPDEPYFSLNKAERRFASCPIKVKKDYFQGFGDVGDFAVVGARYDPVKAKSYRIPNLKWTHFFLGCLSNKDAVQAQQVRPCFTVIDEVELNETQLQAFILYANPIAVPIDDNEAFDLQMPQRITGSKRPTIVFPNPPVFDIRSFSFTKQGNTGFWTPRFPQVSKIHFDRDFMDTVTLSELQSISDHSRSLPDPEDSQEMQDWIAALEAADPRGLAVDAASQLTASSMMTPSPRTSSTRHSQPSNFSPCEGRTRMRGCRLRYDDNQSMSHQTPAHTSRQPHGTTKTCLKSMPENSESSKSQELQAAGRHSERVVSKRSLPNIVFPHPESKRQKLQQNKTPQKDLPTQPASQVGESSSHPRVPLSIITINSTRSRHENSQSSTSTKDPENLIHEAPNKITSIPKKKAMPSKTSPLRPEAPEFVPGGSAPTAQAQVQAPALASVSASAPAPAPTVGITRHRCELSGQHFSLRNRDIILSPCIAQQLLITHEYLPTHGITSWALDPSEWAQPSTPNEAAAATPAAPPAAPSAARRRIKVCFVEPRRKEATRAFMRLIEALELRLPCGGREYVEIYDWRGLQDLHEFEQAHGVRARARVPKPLMKWFVGLV